MFEGKFEGNRKVAVKRVIAQFWSKVDNEQALFLKTDDHENVLRYFTTERCSRYCYIALEFCEGTLEQFIDKDHPKHFVNPHVNGLEILSDALHGIDYLHSLNKPIVHRDVKPSNVLIYIPNGASRNPRGKIADLGLSKQLEQHRETFTTSTNRGSKGWMAPEVLKKPAQKDDKGKITATLKVDIFCSGMLLYYVKSNGKHLFGGEHDDEDIRNYNIKWGIYDFKHLDKLKDGIYINLIEKMIASEPNNRPSMKACLSHPVFWKNERILEFFRVASDYLKEAADVPLNVKTAIERKNAVFTTTEWISQMDPIIQKDVRENKHAKYNGQRVEHILQAIRDYSHHFNKKSAEVRGTLISLDKGLVDYFLDKFPTLLTHTFKSLEPCKSNVGLSPFYDTDFLFA